MRRTASSARVSRLSVSCDYDIGNEVTFGELGREMGKYFSILIFFIVKDRKKICFMFLRKKEKILSFKIIENQRAQALRSREGADRESAPSPSPSAESYLSMCSFF